MQPRHVDRFMYFTEMAETSEKFFIPFINNRIGICEGMEVLEIGCGEGGNLMPFALIGCHVTGVDISTTRIRQAKEFFARNGLNGSFICGDIFKYGLGDKKYDVIICHDVLEHINYKSKLIKVFEKHINSEGVVFVAFPPWQMPFGGHQQISHSCLASHLPFIHLLPDSIYEQILKTAGENHECIEELKSIKTTKINIEGFKIMIHASGMEIIDETYWMINPHYLQNLA